MRRAVASASSRSQSSQQDGEFVAPEASHGVAGPQAALQAGAHLPQQQVAGVMAEGVVYGLEVVDVENATATGAHSRAWRANWCSTGPQIATCCPVR